MKYIVVLALLVVVLATASLAADLRMYYSNGNYNASTSFGGTYHPGTIFKPTSGQYPVFLERAYYGFGSAGVQVQAKVWNATGSTPGSVLASFLVNTLAWPTWTEVDLTGSNLIINADYFFLSTNNPGGGALGVSYRGSMPSNYSGYHFWSSNDSSWASWTTTDWAIECLVDTGYSSVQPASLGRVKALYR